MSCVPDLHERAHLEYFGQFSRSHIRVHVQYLPLGILGQARQDGKAACSYGSFDWRFVNASYPANKSIFGSVEVFGGKNTGRNGTSPGTEPFKGGSEP